MKRSTSGFRRQFVWGIGILVTAPFTSISLNAADIQLPDLSTAHSDSPLRQETESAETEATKGAAQSSFSKHGKNPINLQGDQFLKEQIGGFFSARQDDGKSTNAGDAMRKNLGNTSWQLLAEAVKETGKVDRGTFAAIASEGVTHGVVEALSYSDYALLANMEIETGVTEGSGLDLSISTMQPLWFTEDNQRNLFLQAGLEYYDLRDEHRTGASFGLGYRQLYADNTWLWGSNIFYDYQAPYDHGRLNLGFELENSEVRLGVNAYQAVTDERRSRDGYQERVLDGYDIEASGLVPGQPQFRVGLRGYRWNQYEGANDINGYEGTVEYHHSPAFLFKVSADHNNEDGTEWRGALTFNYRFGVPLAEQLRPFSAPELLDIKNRLFRKVERETRIRTQETIVKVDPPAEAEETAEETVAVIPPAYQPAGLNPGDTYYLIFVTSAAIAGNLTVADYNLHANTVADSSGVKETDDPSVTWQAWLGTRRWYSSVSIPVRS